MVRILSGKVVKLLMLFMMESLRLICLSIPEVGICNFSSSSQVVLSLRNMASFCHAVNFSSSVNAMYLLTKLLPSHETILF